MTRQIKARVASPQGMAMPTNMLGWSPVMVRELRSRTLLHGKRWCRVATDYYCNHLKQTYRTWGAWWMIYIGIAF
jgi:hypothetical protein